MILGCKSAMAYYPGCNLYAGRMPVCNFLSSSMGGIGCLKINFEIAFLFMCGRCCRVSLD